LLRVGRAQQRPGFMPRRRAEPSAAPDLLPAPIEDDDLAAAERKQATRARGQVIDTPGGQGICGGAHRGPKVGAAQS
jgi:hypothetical protein